MAASRTGARSSAARGAAVSRPRRSGEARRADARAKIDETIPWPRWAGRRQQEGVVADPMSLARLAQDEPPAKHGVLTHIGSRFT